MTVCHPSVLNLVLLPFSVELDRPVALLTTRLPPEVLEPKLEATMIADLLPVQVRVVAAQESAQCLQDKNNCMRMGYALVFKRCVIVNS